MRPLALAVLLLLMTPCTDAKGRKSSKKAKKRGDLRSRVASDTELPSMGAVAAAADIGPGSELRSALTKKYTQAMERLQAGKLDEALPMFESLLAAGDYGRGLTLAKMSRFDEARTALDKAIKTSPSHAAAHFQKGVLLDRNLNRYDEAQHALQAAVDIPKKPGRYNAATSPRNSCHGFLWVVPLYIRGDYEYKSVLEVLRFVVVSCATMGTRSCVTLSFRMLKSSLLKRIRKL